MTFDNSETFAALARDYRKLERRAEKNGQFKDANDWRLAAERYEAKAKKDRERAVTDGGK